MRWLHESLLGPGVDKLLYLVIALMNSSLEKGVQIEGVAKSISSSMFSSM